MARKELVAKGPLRYGTRMLQAGDPLELDGPKARLYEALGLAEEPSEEKPAPKPQLDHDGDGKAGGSPKGENSTRRRGSRRKKAAAKK